MMSHPLGRVAPVESSPATVVRTCHIALRLTQHQRERCFGLLRSAGDVWAWIIDSNRERWQQGERDVVSFQALCRALTQKGTFGELPRHAAEQVLKQRSQRKHLVVLPGSGLPVLTRGTGVAHPHGEDREAA